MFQHLKMGRAERFRQLNLDGVETVCPKVFQHYSSAKPTGLATDMHTPSCTIAPRMGVLDSIAPMLILTVTKSG